MAHAMLLFKGFLTLLSQRLDFTKGSALLCGISQFDVMVLAFADVFPACLIVCVFRVPHTPVLCSQSDLHAVGSAVMDSPRSLPAFNSNHVGSTLGKEAKTKDKLGLGFKK